MRSKSFALVLIAVAVLAVAWFALRAAPTESSAAPAIQATAEATPTTLEGEVEFERPELDEAAGRAAAETATATSKRFFGSVREWSGLIVPNATVQLFPLTSAGDEAEVLARAKTDTEGRFVIPAEASWPNAVKAVATAAGYRPRELSPVGPDVEIRLLLHQVADIFGVVSDAETGAAIAGARIVCGRFADVRSGPSGEYRLDDVIAGLQLQVLAQHPDYLAREHQLTLSAGSEHELDLLLYRGTEIPITVVDRATGQPVARSTTVQRVNPFKAHS